MPPSTQEPPDEAALRDGLRRVTDLYIGEADLSKAPGESGFIRVNVEVALDHGRVRFSRGFVAFERRIEIGGRS